MIYDISYEANIYEWYKRDKFEEPKGFRFVIKNGHPETGVLKGEWYLCPTSFCPRQAVRDMAGVIKLQRIVSFNDAMDALLQGNKVRCKWWSPGCYWVVSSLRYLESHSPSSGISIANPPLLGSYLTGEWEIL